MANGFLKNKHTRWKAFWLYSTLGTFFVHINFMKHVDKCAVSSFKRKLQKCTVIDESYSHQTLRLYQVDCISGMEWVISEIPSVIPTFSTTPDSLVTLWHCLHCPMSADCLNSKWWTAMYFRLTVPHFELRKSADIGQCRQCHQWVGHGRNCAVSCWNFTFYRWCPT